MKCSTMMAIVCCGALALAVTGCKYDDPTADELARFERWQARFDIELIDYAAQCARDAEKPFSYMETLLEAWAGEGVTGVEGVGSPVGFSVRMNSRMIVRNAAAPVLKYLRIRLLRWARRRIRVASFPLSFPVRRTRRRGA